MKDKAAKNKSETDEANDGGKIDPSTSLTEDEVTVNRLQEIINRYYKMNIKCDLILYKINKLNKIRKMQQAT